MIGSVAGGPLAVHSGSIYAMTKAALDQLTAYLACEWAADGIRVNCVKCVKCCSGSAACVVVACPGGTTALEAVPQGWRVHAGPHISPRPWQRLSWKTRRKWR